jgi:hypothetical protein
MSTGPVAICNSALLRVGANTIITLDDNTVEGKLCKEQYQKVKEAFLRSHPWKFAIRRTELAASVTPPEFEFDNQFQLPTDCLRVVGTSLSKDQEWTEEGRFLLANTDSIKIKYISNVDEGQFDANAAEALSAMLAYNLSFSLAQSVQLRQLLEDEMKKTMQDARTFSAQAAAGDRVYADTWLNSRY